MVIGLAELDPRAPLQHAARVLRTMVACMAALLSGCDGETVPHDAEPDAMPSVESPYDTLFVGHSFVYVNDVSGHYRSLAGASAPGTRVERVAPGGYRLEQHAADARADGTELATFLRTGPARENAFDYVVLQEQSELGAYPSFLIE